MRSAGCGSTSLPWWPSSKSDLIRLRTREGMKVAKAKGRLRGKQPKFNRRQEAHLVSLVHSGEYSTLEVAGLFGFGRSTVYRAIERQRIKARDGLAEAHRSADTGSGRRPSRFQHPCGTPERHPMARPARVEKTGRR